MTDKEIIDRIYKGLRDIETKIDKLSDKFAGKWVERSFIGGAGAIVMYVIFAIAKTVLAN